MLFAEVIRVALAAINANKMRSLLTMLGIVIGVAAVITMVALGTGAQRAVQAQIDALGTNVLTVRAGQAFFRGARGGNARLTVDEAFAVGSAESIVSVAPEMSSNMQVEYGRSNANLRITGTTPEFQEVNHYEMAAGRFFDEEENRGRRRVAVVGGDVPEVLGTTALQLIGQKISIANNTFEVIGAVEPKGGSGWFNQDEQIFVPIYTAQFRLMGTDRLGSFNVTVGNGASTTLAMSQIEAILRREHRLRVGEANDFWVMDRAELMGTQQETTQTFTYLLAGIALVSLLVGGIGIMNIMLVSVTERTREIGIRMALGATRSAVLTQFLLEALTLCLVGGVIGIGVGIGASQLLSALANWNTSVSGLAVAMAVVFSLTVGLFFGIWPARRAASLDPIEALRWE
ncbi:MAG: ABC transporter permease [Gemmatimonadota bacterium]|nr:ABC transporter permease [Gemmatimonadota bacterium]